MNRRLRRLAPAIGIAWMCVWGVVACGDDSMRPMPTGGSGGGGSGGNGGSAGSGGTGGTGGRHDGGMTTGDGGGTVTIMITAPTMSTVINTANVTVKAIITASNAALDTLSINATIGNEPPVHMTATGVANEFSGTLPVSSLASGQYQITVSAETIDGGGASEVVDVVVNAGPIITIVRPAANEPTNRTLTYDFQVRISSALPGINVGTVTATMGLCSVTLGTPTGPPTAKEFTSTTPVDLTMCNPPLVEGPLQFTVVAQDTSNPPVRATKSQVFVIDRTGPVITVQSPLPGALVGGIITVQAQVADPSGVQDSTVFATISHGGAGFTFALNPIGSGVYSNTFDTRTLPNPRIIQFPAIEVVADDALGNHSTTGGIEFTLDNNPPIAELDPGRMVIVKGNCRSQQSPCKCSEEFDPVGDPRPLGDQPNDLMTVAQIFDLRAEIVDQGNAGTGTDVIFVSNVSRATLYVIDVTTQPLVVDSDGDGTCDTINPNVVPITGMPPGPNQAVAINMIKVPPQGQADFVPPTYAGATPFGPPNCVQGDDQIHPAPLCLTSGTLQVAVANTIVTPPEPLIWTIPPQAMNQLQCVGLPFDALANNIANGWVCVAVRAIDGIGNESVSPPMRLCVDRSGNGVCNDGAAPNCTGTLNRATGQVSSTPACTSRRFAALQFLSQP